MHAILRNVLDGCEDAYVLRAAELFFRPQRMTLHEGSLIAADEETIAGTNASVASPLVSMLGIPAEAEIDIINDDNARAYFERSDRFDMALDLTAGRRGLAALGEAIARWIEHLLGVEVDDRAAHRSCATPISPGMSGSMPTAPGSATRCGTAKNSTMRRWRASSGCSA